MGYECHRNTSAGADGTKLADLDSDGDQDIAAGWEQGNIARLYFDPGDADERWPFLSLPAPDVEEALPVDLDGDGYHDIVTSSKGDYQRVTIHWAPSNRSRYKNVAYWKTRDVSTTVGKTRWMFAEPTEIDGRHGIDLVVGSKDPNGTLAQLAIKFSLAPPEVTTLILGARTSGQVKRNLAAANLPELDSETLRDLNEMFAGFEEVVNV